MKINLRFRKQSLIQTCQPLHPFSTHHIHSTQTTPVKHRTDHEAMELLEQSIVKVRWTSILLIIVHCNTFQSSLYNCSWNNSPRPGRCRDSLWWGCDVRIQGWRSSPSGPASSAAGSNSPGRCSAGSGSARRWSQWSWTPSWWGSRSRRKRRRRKSPAVRSHCDPQGCRASASLGGSREPEEKTKRREEA